jgi:transposase
MIAEPALLLDLRTTLVVAVEVSKSAWVIAAHVPGLQGTKIKQRLEPRADALIGAMAQLRQRAAGKGNVVERTVAAYESGYSGFWLARVLRRAGIEVQVIQPVSVPVDRRARRAKTDAIDVDLLLRTCLAFLRGEPRVCSMVPVPEEADEDARHPGREREELVAERIALTNRIGAILTTLGVEGYDPLRRDRRRRLGQLRTALGGPLPANAEARILRMLDRLELVLGQISVLEAQRDAVLEQAERTGAAAAMIRRLAGLRGVGVQTATTLVREGFVRSFRSAKALGSYAGLVGTPFASGGIDREQGITKAGNRRLRTAVVETAWLWLRYQPGSGLAVWFRHRLGEAGGRMRKVLVVALARKLLIALWRFAVQGLVPQGASARTA